MGSSCSSRLTHNNTNDCTADLISGFNRNFCTASLVTTEIPTSINFCKSIGDNEFTADLNNHYSCFYNDGTNVDRWDTSAGCCGWTCAIAGAGFDCKRIARRGNPTICCYRDKACLGFNQI